MIESVDRQIVALVGQQNFPKSVHRQIVALVGQQNFPECNILKKSHNCSEITFIYCALETY